MTYPIVLRNCPPTPAEHEGRWYYLPQSTVFHMVNPKSTTATRITFYPTGRFEVRDDGARAEVYEPRISEEQSDEEYKRPRTI